MHLKIGVAPGAPGGYNSNMNYGTMTYEEALAVEAADVARGGDHAGYVDAEGPLTPDEWAAWDADTRRAFIEALQG